MLCLEVAVNGERLCVARAADPIAMLVASVTQGGGLDDATDRDKTALSVHGMSGDLKTDYYWGKEKFALKTGDVITIRVVGEVVADNPIPFSRSPSVIKLRERVREIKQRQLALAGLDQPSLEQERRAGLRRLLFWCAVVLLGVTLWWLFRSLARRR